jgi:N6-L-threonylcarbamoyladenine synthase
MRVLALDTSNYTTSAAVFDGADGKNCSRLLPVRPGELGLRQSDALFFHVQRLPEIMKELFDGLSPDSLCAVGASTRPRAVEGSYMPCFLAGQSQAENLALALGVPFCAVSHQQGHIAAALWSAGRMDLMARPHLAWHLSGGTTELLLVGPDGKNVRAERIGGTTDLSAGQLIDRTGKLLGCDFPAGKAIDALSRESKTSDCFRVRLDGLNFSFSGVQNQVETYVSAGHSREDAARFALLSVISTVLRATKAALKQYPDFPVVFSGGVASNSLLRERCREMDAVFAQPQYSTDNALGAAVLTWLQEAKG